MMGFDLEGLRRGAVAERGSIWLSSGHIYKVLASLICKGRWNRKRQPRSNLVQGKISGHEMGKLNLRYFFA